MYPWGPGVVNSPFRVVRNRRGCDSRDAAAGPGAAWEGAGAAERMRPGCLPQAWQRFRAGGFAAVG